MRAMLNRRDAFVGLAVAGWVVPVVAHAVDAMPAWTPRALSAAQARTLSAAVDRMMPATDTPGAVEAGVPQAIDRWVADWCAPADAQAIKAGLDRLDADARAAGGASFAALAPAQQDAILTKVDAEARGNRGHFFAQLNDFVTAGYFTSQPGATKALRYDPVPGAYHGCIPFSSVGRTWATT